MSGGDFLDVYKDQTGEWDCIVTCFFLDTAPVVFEYIEAFDRLLKVGRHRDRTQQHALHTLTRMLLQPGGVWINFGPLAYHWQSQGQSNEKDERYHRSVELSYTQVKTAIESYGFKFTVSVGFVEICVSCPCRVCAPSAERLVIVAARI